VVIEVPIFGTDLPGNMAPLLTALGAAAADVVLLGSDGQPMSWTVAITGGITGPAVMGVWSDDAIATITVPQFTQAGNLAGKTVRIGGVDIPLGDFAWLGPVGSIVFDSIVVGGAGPLAGNTDAGAGAVWFEIDFDVVGWPTTPIADATVVTVQGGGSGPLAVTATVQGAVTVSALPAGEGSGMLRVVIPANRPAGNLGQFEFYLQGRRLEIPTEHQLAWTMVIPD
jgi:hypothetical protein